jgi:DNA helicase II / ATP-dependent DNA helicase PcrA
MIRGHAVQDPVLKRLRNEPRLTQGNLQIIACAGSGKTDFVSTRIAYLVAAGLAKPENIVAFTFTERAAEELKFRIRSKIRQLIGHQPDIGDLYVGTIHSFCFELLKEYAPGYRGFDVLDEGKRYSFVTSIRNDLGYHDLEDWLASSGQKKPYGITNQAWVLNTLIRGIDIVREEMRTPDEISACEAFPTAMEIYDQKLQDRRFLDFSSMMAHAVQRLQSDAATLEEVRKRFTHITVDEYQDINPIQEKLIKLLAGKDGNLCVVGDDDQSIYQWRGSSVDNIINFRKRYRNAFTHPLETNYRSTDLIINLSKDLIVKNKRRLQKEIRPSKRKAELGDIYKVNFHYQASEANFIVDRIKSLIGTRWTDNDGHTRGLAYSDIAIFFRSVRYDSRAYLDALDEAGIRYAVSGIGGLFEAPEVDIVFDVFSYLGDFGKIWVSDIGVGITPQPDSIYNRAKKVFPLPAKRAFIAALQQLKQDYEGKGRISLQGLYADILVLLGIPNPSFHTPDHEIHMYNLGRLSQAISDYEGTRTYCTYRDIQNLCWFMKHYAEGSYDAGAGEDPTRVINAVQVMTLHATKGLGFPVVFMPNCFDREPRQTPQGFLDPSRFDFTRYHGSTEDERRLFYVGMTRAKKFLFITTSHDPGPRKRKKYPSPFFDELNDLYCITENEPDPTPRRKLPPQPSVEDYRFPTNYSELSDYIRCEYDYKMRYIYGFNPIIVQALGYGKQVHNILNLLHKVTQETGYIPTEEQIAQAVIDHFYLRYAAREQQDTLQRSALRSILRYAGMWHEDFSLSVHTERRFEMDVDRALVSGSIDLLKRRYPEDNVLEIVDFKTGNERKLDEELDLQVQLYTIAARDVLSLDVQKAYVHFLDEHKQERVEIPITAQQLDLAMRTVRDAIVGITGRRFRRNPRNKKNCDGCDWSKICPGRQR